MVIDLTSPFLARRDPPVVPGLDHTLSLQDGKMIIQGLAKLVVFMRVRNEDTYRRGVLHRDRLLSQADAQG
jgi:hypothetical protein